MAWRLNRINRNQGAESSVSYLLARLKLEELKRGFLKQKETAKNLA